MEGYPVALAKVADLKPYDRNARTHPRDQIEQIKGLIRLVGFTNPLLVDGEGIIAGHGRQIAVMEMLAEGESIPGPGKRFMLPDGLVPVIDGSGMSEAERRAFIIADNQVAANSGWDDRLLETELHALKGLDFDLSALGFSDDRLAGLMNIPTFEPVSFDSQSRLDQKEPTRCPKCGHEWRA
jgi:ParB-like chromosome segregation protein Spo0J